MRRIFLITIVLFSSVHLSFAQDEWAPIGAKWFYSFADMGAPGLEVITSIKDTIIQNKICKKLEFQQIFRSMNSEGEYFIDTTTSYEYFYFENNSVFHYDKADYFYKLYDFLVSSGDTVLVRDTSYSGNFPYARFEYFVDSISQMTINEKDYLIIHNSPTRLADWSFSNFVESFPIIEKIGSTRNFFGTSTNIAISSGNFFLRCYMDSELSYRSELWDDSLSCDCFNYNLTITPQIKPSVKVFPNPFNESLQVIQELNKFEYFQIINLTGRICHEDKITDSTFTINLSSLPKGIYILSLISSNHSYRQRILKI